MLTACNACTLYKSGWKVCFTNFTESGFLSERFSIHGYSSAFEKLREALKSWSYCGARNNKLIKFWNARFNFGIKKYFREINDTYLCVLKSRDKKKYHYVINMLILYYATMRNYVKISGTKGKIFLLSRSVSNVAAINRSFPYFTAFLHSRYSVYSTHSVFERIHMRARWKCNLARNIKTHILIIHTSKLWKT